MKSTPRSDRLSRALRDLETQSPSPGFTLSVLGRLDERDRLRRRRRALRLVLAVQAVAVVLVVAALLVGREAAPVSTTARADELRQERQALIEELERLQRASDDERVLYLGALQEYDLVLDLDQILDQSMGPPVVPALQDLRVQAPRAIQTVGRRP